MFMANEPAIGAEPFLPTIYLVRGKRVILDSDLAKIYGVTTRRLKEQFRRNADRFPEDFAFVVTNQEVTILRSQFAASSSWGGMRYLPVAFTEHGAIMIASILNSKRAVEMSIFVVRAFVQMRELISGNKQLTEKLVELENLVGKHDQDIAALFEAIRQLLGAGSPKLRREIRFHVKEQAAKYRTRNGR
jgi:hypothetical protein